MKDMTKAARRRLETYLDEVKLCLKGARSVDSTEVERDITEHIAQELESAAEPVDVDVIEKVLTRLGSPRQWLPAEEMSWFRKAALRLRTGPDDWRLAYITIGTFIAACISGPGAILFLPLSFYFARVTLHIAGGAEKLGNQKYLLYPSLICIYVLLTLALLGLPLLLLSAADGLERRHAGWGFSDDLYYWLFAWSVISVITGGWWLATGFLSLRRAEQIYYPFRGCIVKRFGWGVCIVGVMLVAAGLISIVLNPTWAG